MQIGMDASQEPAARAAILGQASRAYLMTENGVQARAATQAATIPSSSSA